MQQRKDCKVCGKRNILSNLHFLECQFYAPSLYNSIVSSFGKLQPKYAEILLDQLRATLVEVEKAYRLKQQIQINKQNDQQFAADPISCTVCKKQFFQNSIVFQTCGHIYCKRCYRRIIRQLFTTNQGLVKCTEENCDTFFDFQLIKSEVGQLQFQKLVKQVQQRIPNKSRVTCNKCRQQLNFVPQEDIPIYDDDNRPLMTIFKKHYQQNKFTCPKCKFTNCRLCGQIPYHLGKTCRFVTREKHEVL